MAVPSMTRTATQLSNKELFAASSNSFDTFYEKEIYDGTKDDSSYALEDEDDDMSSKTAADLFSEYIVTESLQAKRNQLKGIESLSAAAISNRKLDVGSLLQFAKKQFSMGNFTAAQEAYELCIQTNPSEGRAYIGLGRIHWKRRRLDLADQAYEAGLRYCPNSPHLLQAKAVLLEKQGQLSEAKKILLKS
eukprot:gene42549-51990_t